MGGVVVPPIAANRSTPDRAGQIRACAARAERKKHRQNRRRALRKSGASPRPQPKPKGAARPGWGAKPPHPRAVTPAARKKAACGAPQTATGESSVRATKRPARAFEIAYSVTGTVSMYRALKINRFYSCGTLLGLVPTT